MAPAGVGCGGRVGSSGARPVGDQEEVVEKIELLLVWFEEEDLPLVGFEEEDLTLVWLKMKVCCLFGLKRKAYLFGSKEKTGHS